MDKQLSLLLADICWILDKLSIFSALTMFVQERRNKQRLWCDKHAVTEGNDNLEIISGMFW